MVWKNMWDELDMKSKGLDRKNYSINFLNIIRKLSNQDLLTKAQIMKHRNISDNSKVFQRQYNTILFELDRRGLLKK